MSMREKIKRLGEDNPDLDLDGYLPLGHTNDKSPFADPSDEIVAQVEAAFRYLNKCQKVDRFNQEVSSGALKNYAREFSKLDGIDVYVRNGCLIVGAMIAGFAVRPTKPGRHDAYLTIGFHALPPGYWSHPCHPPRRRRPK